MAPRDKLKKTVAEDKKRLYLRLRKLPWGQYLAVGSGVGLTGFLLLTVADFSEGFPAQMLAPLALSAFPKAFRPLELRVVRQLQKAAEAIELNEQSDGKDKTPNPLLDEYGCDYCGGHPNWQVTKVEYGQLQLFERALVFKNLKNRFRLPLSRVNRVSLESQLQIKMRKLNDVQIPSSTMPRNPVLRKLVESRRRRLRMVLVDYTDDQGQTRLIGMWPPGGNPRMAKQMKEGIDAALTRLGKERPARSETGKISSRPPLDPLAPAKVPSRSSGPAAVKAVSQDAIAAAQEASRPHSTGPALSSVLQDVSAATTCPYCKFSLKEPIVHCSVCGLEHHEGCWKANYGCTKECLKAKGLPGPRAGTEASAEGEPQAGVASAPPAAESTPQAAASDPHPPSATLPGARFQVLLADAGKTTDQQEAVARQMAQDFGIELEKVKVVLGRLPAVARRNLPESEALALADRFRAMGADASIQPMS